VHKTLAAVWATLIWPYAAIAAESGTLGGPDKAPAGSSIEVSWTGPVVQGDFISVDPQDAPERTYNSGYAYPSAGLPARVTVPATPGSYLIRYHVALTYAVSATAAIEVTPISATLTAPTSVAIGAPVAVHWTGPNNPQDFISIDVPGVPDRQYGNYAYPNAGNPVSIRAPDTPGDYEVRYHLAAGYTVIGTTVLRVTGVTATLESVDQAEAGAAVQVRWTGPNNPQDFISIDEPSAADRTYGPYAYASSGNPVTIRAPDNAGDYEVRYHLGSSYSVIGRTPLRIGGANAALDAADTVPAGGSILVQWTGPDHPQDFISIDPVDAEDRSYGPYAYSAAGNPLQIRVPDTAGSYLLRYHTGQTAKVLTTRPLTVTPVTATLDAPTEVVAGQVFEVRWQGPDNEGDFITLVTPATEQKRWGANNAYPKRGNPLRIEAPRAPGDYQLRYLTGLSYAMLASAPIRVTPDTTAGRLRVIAADNAPPSGFNAVELVVDASGSMLARLNGERRIDLAKRALDQMLTAIPPGTQLALRVFGAQEANACRTDLELALAPLNVSAAAARISEVEPKNLAKTPIGESLLKVKGDLAGHTGSALVVLMTDGEETCNGDPAAAIESLRTAGLDVRVNIVGFAIDEIGVKDKFRTWARMGNGSFFDAQSGDELAAAVRSALRATFEVVDGDDVVATGAIGDEAIDLPPGSYVVRIPGTSRQLAGVVVEPGAIKEVQL
jgi:hypothetical protein